MFVAEWLTAHCRFLYRFPLQTCLLEDHYPICGSKSIFHSYWYFAAAYKWKD